MGPLKQPMGKKMLGSRLRIVEFVSKIELV